MKTITKTFNIYEFDELNEEIKEKVIKEEEEDIRQFDIDCCLEEEMNNLAELLLEENFGEKAILKKVYYSLSYSQGDGVVVEFDLVRGHKEIRVRHNRSRNYYEFSFDIEEVGEFFLSDNQLRALKEKIIRINKKLADYGYQYIEEDRTEQAIEQLKNCMFYENGEIY